MAFVRGNKALLDTSSNGKTVYLFEYIRAGYVAYVGELAYLDHHFALAPDVTGQERRVIAFELALVGEQEGEEEANELLATLPVGKLWQMPIEQVRVAALAPTPRRTPLQKQRANTYFRSEAVKVYVLRRASGICEGYGQSAPFVTRQ